MMAKVPFQLLPLNSSKYDKPNTIPGTVFVNIEMTSIDDFPLRGVLTFKTAELKATNVPSTAVIKATNKEFL